MKIVLRDIIVTKRRQSIKLSMLKFDILFSDYATVISCRDNMRHATIVLKRTTCICLTAVQYCMIVKENSLQIEDLVRNLNTY